MLECGVGCCVRVWSGLDSWTFVNSEKGQHTCPVRVRVLHVRVVYRAEYKTHIHTHTHSLSCILFNAIKVPLR